MCLSPSLRVRRPLSPLALLESCEKGFVQRHEQKPLLARLSFHENRASAFPIEFTHGKKKLTWNELISAAKKTVFATRIFWGLASPAVRLSVLCLYYRLLNHAKGRQYRWILHCMTGFTIAMMMVFVFGAIFACV